MKTKIDMPGNAVDILLGRQVKKLREDAGLSVGMMAGPLNITVEKYRLYESGAYQFFPETMVVMSQTIGCPVVSFYALVHASTAAGEDHKVPSTGEIGELLYYFAGVASPLARRKVISGARAASAVAAVPASTRV